MPPMTVWPHRIDVQWCREALLCPALPTAPPRAHSLRPPPPPPSSPRTSSRRRAQGRRTAPAVLSPGAQPRASGVPPAVWEGRRAAAQGQCPPPPPLCRGYGPVRMRPAVEGPCPRPPRRRGRALPSRLWAQSGRGLRHRARGCPLTPRWRCCFSFSFSQTTALRAGRSPQPPVRSLQPSAVGRPLPAVTRQPPVTDHQPPAVRGLFFVQ